jgi:predicted HD superfamily hydrolase involved in NAD metabolism
MASLPPLPDWAITTPHRRAHIRRVAKLMAKWADRLGVSDAERARWLRAAMFHDALKDAPADTVAALALPKVGPRKLWHGPAAAVRAERAGERDQGVLDAVRYHSVGYAGWDQVGRMLYLADYLEPGRRHADEREAQRKRVGREPEGVLREIARERIVYGLSRNWPLLAETVAFWNALS